MEILPLGGAFLLGALLCLGAVLAFGGRISRLGFLRPVLGRAESVDAAAEATLPEQPFDAVAAAQELLEKEGELRGLYRRLGFSLGLEQRAQAILEEIKAGVEVEIPDYQAFRRSVGAALRELGIAEGDEAGSGGDRLAGDPLAGDPLARARRARAADPLLAAVVAAPDEAAAKAALGRAPVDEVLPYLEEVPLTRSGTVVWRTPMGLDVLHKRAKDPAALLRRLEELVQRVNASALRREPKAKAELLKAAAALRQAVEGGQTYLVTPIKTLEAKLAQWYLAPEDSAARQRRRQLDELLLDLVRLRRETLCEAAAASGSALKSMSGGALGGPREASATGLKERATALAQGYVSTPELHTPRLSQLLLEPLLSVEAAAARGPKPLPRDDPDRLLLTVAGEVRSGRFDGEESVRRLRSLEPRGLFVHSLVYRLLKMASPSSKEL